MRTNQIGMMEITGFSGNSSIYQFSHHPYAPGGPMPSRDVPLELFTVSRNFDMVRIEKLKTFLPNDTTTIVLPRQGRRDIRDYESQAFPHDLPLEYPQTVFLPITIRNNSDDTTPESSGYNTPRTVEDGPCLRTKSAEVARSEKLAGKQAQRKILSAEYLTQEPSLVPSGTIKQKCCKNCLNYFI